MLYLPQLPLKPSLQRHLAKAQAKIDALPTYRDRVYAAKTAWQTKKKKKAQRSAFERIERTLQMASPYCHYCEAVPGTAIEHIYPRGFFPNQTFRWSNYVWSCFTCNTTCKGAQFQLFETADGHTHQPLLKNYRFEAPHNEDTVFLHPRQDDPLSYWALDLETGHWVPKAPKGTRAHARAVYTCAVLRLTERPRLVASRRQAIADYQRLLAHYLLLLAAPTDARIRAQLPHKGPRFQRHPLQAQASLAALALQRRILGQPHPSVWRSLQRQQPALFEQSPEALDW